MNEKISYRWYKTFASHIFHQGLVSRIYKEFSQCNNNNKNSFRKWPNDMNTYVTKDNMPMTKKKKTLKSKCWYHYLSRKSIN